MSQVTEPGDTPPAAAHRAVAGGVARIVKLADPDGFTARPMYDGDPWPREEPDPLPALRALRILANAVATAEYFAMQRARAAGVGWAEIGAVWGLDAASGYERFLQGPEDWRWGRYLTWVCDGCGATVADYGPYAPRKGEQEDGHAGTCPRLSGPAVEPEDRLADGAGDGR